MRTSKFGCLCRPAMRGLHYGQELVSTNRPDTFAQTNHPRQRFCLQSRGGPYNFHGLFLPGDLDARATPPIQCAAPAANAYRDRLSMSASAISHTSRRGLCFSEHRAGFAERNRSAEILSPLSRLSFLFRGVQRGLFLFPEGSLAVIWLELRCDQANFQIADHFSRKCIEPPEASLGFPIATGSTFRNFGALVRIPVVCSIMS